MEVEAVTEVRQEQKPIVGICCEGTEDLGDTVATKLKKRPSWLTKTTSRKSAKKSSMKNNRSRPSDAKDDNVLLKPFQLEDDPSYPILLSNIYKAEKVELNANRLAASGTKGYRMVRATRGVVEGAWYFEIYVEKLGNSGHTRLGWSTRLGDIQAPVGYDAHSYAYRDLDGTKVHSALREQYGKAYFEKDVIGFYINLPRERGFTRKAEEVVGFKGQPYVVVTDETLKPVPGSEILFFKNGVCQGVAYTDIYDGTYFPAASMYTLPSQDCCKVIFNFGPDFRYPVTDVGNRPLPSPMCQASWPGAGRPGEVSTTQTAVVVGSKQRMVPDCTTAGRAGESITIIKEEKAPEPGGKPPVMKKKIRIPKMPFVSSFTTSPKKPEVEVSCFDPDFRQDVDQKLNKKVGFGLHSLPIRKAVNQDGIGAGLLGQKVAKKAPSGAEMQAQKSAKEDIKGIGSLNQRGFRNDFCRTSLLCLKSGKKDTGRTGTGLLIHKVVPRDLIVSTFPNPNNKVSKKNMSAPRLAGFQGSERHITGVKLPGLKGNKKDVTGKKMPVVKLGKVNNPPSSLQRLMREIKKDASGAVLCGSKSGKKGILSSGSALLKVRKDSSSTGFGSAGLVRQWEEGIHEAMDVDVVVVESSSNFQTESSCG